MCSARSFHRESPCRRHLGPRTGGILQVQRWETRMRMLCSLPRARIQRLVFPLTIVFHVIDKMYYVHLRDKKKKSSSQTSCLFSDYDPFPCQIRTFSILHYSLFCLFMRLSDCFSREKIANSCRRITAIASGQQNPVWSQESEAERATWPFQAGIGILLSASKAQERQARST